MPPQGGRRLDAAALTDASGKRRISSKRIPSIQS